MKSFWFSKHSMCLVITLLLTILCQRNGLALSLFKDGRWPISSAGYYKVPVCITSDSEAGDGSLSLAIKHLRYGLAETWEDGSGVRFTDWRYCTKLSPIPNDYVRLKIMSNPGIVPKAWVGFTIVSSTTGTTLTNRNNRSYEMRLNAWGRNISDVTICKGYESDCIRSYGAHEFGHILGYTHEADRHDPSPGCNGAAGGNTGVYAPQRFIKWNRSSYPNQSQIGSASFINFGDYDKHSLMAYADGCGEWRPKGKYVRFGSFGLSRTDRNANKLVYPKPTQGDTDIGVLAGRSNAGYACAGQEAITVFMDSEDDNAESWASGWTGKSAVKERNVYLEFCRVDASAHTFSQSKGSYAVLKLGKRCPSGSESFNLYMDSEDSDNTNFVSGDISPGWFDRSEAGGTKLFFCYFPSDENSTNNLPDLGYPYGVFSTERSVSNLSSGSIVGYIFSDDEDNKNNNKAIYSSSMNFKLWTGQKRKLPIYQNRNTELHIIKVDD